MDMKRSLAFLMAACFFMENLDATIVTTAAPSIGRDLGVSAAGVGLIITAYVVALAVVIPLGNWLITRLPMRTVFVSAVLIFTAASLACACADDLTTLTALRVLQGIGGALMVPVGRQAVLREAPKEKVLAIMSFIVWPGLLAPVIAPLAGGLITTHAGWQTIFWINVPLGMLAAVAAFRLIPAVTDGGTGRFDAVGFVLLGCGLGGVTWSAHLIGDTAATSTTTWAWVLGAGLACAAAVAHLRRHASPIVDIGVLRDRVLGISQLSVSGFWMIVSAVPFLMPLMMQTVFGWSPVTAGVVVMFVFAGNICAKPFTTALIRAFGFRPLLAFSTAGLVLVTALTGLCTASAGPVPLAALAFIGGILRSIALTAFSVVGFATIGPESRRAANTVVVVNQQIATGLGVAAAAIAISLAGRLTEAGTHTAFAWAFVLIAAVGLVPAITVWLLPRNAGSELRPAARRSPSKVG